MDSRKLDFYDLDATIVGAPGRELLHKYSNIPEDDIDNHVEAIREKAFGVVPYPCIGMFQFMDLSMMNTKIYPEIIERLKEGEKFLDLGCCLGQETRRLVFDGAPSANTYGCDLWSELLAIGYELFRDNDRLQTTFIAANVFDDVSRLTELAGQINIIYTGAFFHLFSLEEQERIAIRLVQLLAPQPGSLILGRQSGSESAGEFSRSGDKSGRKHFRHNAQSWKELWDRIGEKTETRWLVEADLDSPEFGLTAAAGKSVGLQNKMTSAGLRFTIKRLS